MGTYRIHISPGEKFTLNVSPHDYEVELLNFIATAQVQHIPTPNSDAGPVILVDYRSSASIYKDKFGNESDVVVPANTLCLRTVDDPGALNGIRQTLAKGDLRLQFVYDRRALATTLYREPLYLTLSGILGLGAVTALLLALVGNLMASWLSVRSRLTSFTVLRALGATPAQVAVMLTWEQCLIYASAVLLGILLGVIFSALAVPALTFTGTTPNGMGKKKPQQLSGGEQQRVAIAVALANSPRLLLADEPTGELDSVTAQEIVHLLRTLNQQLGLTIITVTHDTTIAVEVDRTIAIRDGRTSTETVRRETVLETIEAHMSASTIIGLPSEIHRESVLIDRAGRLQLPKEAIERIPFNGKAEVRITDDHVEFWSIAGELNGSKASDETTPMSTRREERQ
jgi:ABC-type uncharacterized transport system YnjBCD ATPase subunit